MSPLLTKYLKCVSIFCVFVAVLLCSETLLGQTVLINALDGGFESGTTFAANGWTEVNTPPLQTNQWFCASTGVTGFTGARCAFVGTAATNNNYNNVASVSHIYRDIVFPAGLTDIRLYFRYKVRGRSNEDYMAVYVVPVSTVPAAGVILPAGQQGVEYRNQTTWANDSLILPCNFAGTTQRLVFSWVNDGVTNSNPAIAIDNILLVASGGGLCTTLLGTGVFNVPTLPYNSGPGSTCGFNDDIRDVDVTVCGDPAFYGDEDVVWIFSPAVSGPVSIDLNAPVGVSTGLMLYDGCPVSTCNGNLGTCVAAAQDITGNKTMCVSLLAGHTYYLILDGDGVCNDYDNLYISAPNSGGAGTTCANPVLVGALPYHAPNQTTACMGDDYNNGTSGSCTTLYQSGEDKVYQYNGAANECLSIVLTNMSSSSMGFSVYLNCPGAGGVCIGSFGGSSPLITSITLPSSGTYYIIVDSWAPPSSVSYDLSITSYGSSAIANDLPCGAVNLPTGVLTFGDNNCSGGTGEPSAPACWNQPGTLNTVWFKTTVPASGNLTISTQLITLSNSQIAVYSGSCSALTQIGCNDDVSALNPASGLTLAGLTAGSVIYISVDGFNQLEGTFNILVNESAVSGGYNNQDCLGAISVCNPVINQSSSYFGPGLINEIPAPGTVSNPSNNPAGYNSGCLLSGERNIVWFSIHINTSGLLSWKLTHLPGCYDWIMYNLTNNTCQDILNNTLAPVRCNWNGGCLTTAGMMDPVPAGSSPFDFQLPLPVNAGETYVLALSNWSGTSGSFTLDFSSSTCVIGGSNALNWNGSAGTSWNNSSNWGGCTIPVCGISTTIFPAPSQPVVSANATVQNLTVLPGASLTVNAGVTLNVCGDFTNLGVITMSPSSTLLMNSGVVQQIGGLLTAPNNFGNVVINKSAGSVLLNASTEVSGSLSILSNLSILNSNGQRVIVGGDFTNAGGSATYTNTSPTGVLEFNGAILQHLTTGGLLNVHHLMMSNSGPGMVLTGGNVVLDTLGVLQLDSGIIATGTNEVVVLNTDPASVAGASATSYIQGKLRRYLSGSPASYSFPVGHSLKGYQPATVEFTTTTLITDLLATFSPYNSVPVGPLSNDCFGYNYNLLPVLDNGYWSVNTSANASSGVFNLTLNSSSFSPVSSYATVIASQVSPPVTASWYLSGNCDPLSTPSIARRTGMNGFGVFGVGVAVSGTLPVALMLFDGQSQEEGNNIFWTTASEFNSRSFTVEFSVNGRDFSELETVPASGYSDIEKNYSVYDRAPAEITYYRLRSVDLDGSESFSKVILIKHSQHHVSFSVQPNPLSDMNTLFFQFPADTYARLLVYNASGTVVDELFHGSTGVERHLIQIDSNRLSQGIYYYRLISDISAETQKVIKL